MDASQYCIQLKAFWNINNIRSHQIKVYELNNFCHPNLRYMDKSLLRDDFIFFNASRTASMLRKQPIFNSWLSETKSLLFCVCDTNFTVSW